MMKRRRLGVLLVLAAIGSAIGGLRVAAPQRYEKLASNAEQYVSGLPDPVVLAIVFLFIIVVWIAAMILAAKVLYWAWQQVNDYVYWAFDLVLPESPIIRFGVGIIILVVLFLLGPLFVLQTVDLGESENPVNQSDVNDTDAPNTTDANATDINGTDANATDINGTDANATDGNGTAASTNAAAAALEVGEPGHTSGQ